MQKKIPFEEEDIIMLLIYDKKRKGGGRRKKYCMWVIFLPDIMVLPSNALSSRPETNWAL